MPLRCPAIRHAGEDDSQTAMALRPSVTGGKDNRKTAVRPLRPAVLGG